MVKVSFSRTFSINSDIVFSELFVLWGRFLKPFFKREKSYALAVYRGWGEFGHFSGIWALFGTVKKFLTRPIMFSSSRGSFSKKNLSKTDLPFRFCILGSKSFLFFKMVVCFCCCCCFQQLPFLLRFWPIKSRNWSSRDAEKGSVMQNFRKPSGGPI